MGKEQQEEEAEEGGIWRVVNIEFLLHMDF